ncbi:MAG: TPM domain-containing protein [bacterium]
MQTFAALDRPCFDITPPRTSLPARNTLSKPAAFIAVIVALVVVAGYRSRAAGNDGTRVGASAKHSPAQPDSAPGNAAPHVIDEAHFLDGHDIGRMEGYFNGMYKESGVDVRFMFVSGISGDIATFARERARSLGLGRTTDRRGLLLVYDVDGQQLRIEVGPGLEGVFPDGFLGYLMREQTAIFFAAGDRSHALSSTAMVINFRLREAALNEGFNRRAVAYIRDSVRLAAGAGATTRATVATDSNALHATALTVAMRERFGPQPTVAGTLVRYEEALRDGYFQPDLPLYAPGSDAVLIRWPLTEPYAQFMLFSEYGHKYTIIERGDLAILFYTSTPFVSPHLFRRFADGWHMDLASEVGDTQEHVGGPYTWEIKTTGDDFLRAFADLFSEYNGLLRPTAGDNRALPMAHP